MGGITPPYFGLTGGYGGCGPPYIGAGEGSGPTGVVGIGGPPYLTTGPEVGHGSGAGSGVGAGPGVGCVGGFVAVGVGSCTITVSVGSRGGGGGGGGGGGRFLSQAETREPRRVPLAVVTHTPAAHVSASTRKDRREAMDRSVALNGGNVDQALQRAIDRFVEKILELFARECSARLTLPQGIPANTNATPWFDQAGNEICRLPRPAAAHAAAILVIIRRS
jgi:hypothetical protein